jgi:hypothetical protein
LPTNETPALPQCGVHNRSKKYTSRKIGLVK